MNTNDVKNEADTHDEMMRELTIEELNAVGGGAGGHIGTPPGLVG